MKIWIFSLLMLGACAQAPTFKKSPVPMVFLHGSHFTADVWQEVLKAWPEERPLRTFALPSRTQAHGMSGREAAEFVCGSMQEPAIYVAHSFGGVVVQNMVALCPAKIKQIIYVTAVTVLPKEKPFDTFTKLEMDQYNTGVKMDGKRITPISRDAFFLMMAGPDFRPDPLWPSIYAEDSTKGGEPVNYKLQTWLDIPKAYIIATEDKLVLPDSQRAYIKRGRIETVREIKSNHIPMVTQPKELAKMLADLAIL